MFKVLHSEVNGRLRVKIAELYRSNELKLFFENNFKNYSIITSYRINLTIGTILIFYNSSSTFEEIISILKSILSQYKSKNHSADSTVINKFEVELYQHNQPKKKVIEKKKGIIDKLLSLKDATEDKKWHLMNTEEILKYFNVEINKGLNNEVVVKKIKKFGKNTLPESESRSKFEIFLEQFKSLPVLLLGVSSIVSIFTGGIADAIVISTVIMLNAIIGYLTESDVEKTITSLKKIVSHYALVIREGKIYQIPTEDIVPGDIFILKPGFFVPADGRIIEAQNLYVDESALTGESMPVLKISGTLFVEEDLNIPLADMYNMVFMGTNVTGGHGIAISVATGKNTEIGKIQSLMNAEIAPKTHIEQQLDIIGRDLVYISTAVCGFFFLVGILRGYSLLEMFKMSVALAIAAVPEGLPTVATTTLSYGIKKLKRRGILIRHLNAIENLGLIQTICLDKTGTLTYNKMKVSEIYVDFKSILIKDNQLYLQRVTADKKEISKIKNLKRLLNKPELDHLLTVSVLCNESEIIFKNDCYEIKGSSTEKALIEFAINMGLDVSEFIKEYKHITTKYRTQNVNYMITIHEKNSSKGRYFYVAIKGNPNQVINMCNFYLHNGQIKRMNDIVKKRIELENERMAGDALRVLGFAYGIEENEININEENLDEILNNIDFCWIGLIGMSDPLRESVKDFISGIKNAHIDAIMITGDQTPTAYAIAKELNISKTESINILDSTKLNALNTEILSSLSESIHVFARVSPENKLQIVKALKNKGKIVAMTGDGINDGPALKSADIGIAMGASGTDVAREVADIIIEDDNLYKLIEAIAYGRSTYNNIRKSLRFLLSTNLSEIIFMMSSIGIGVGHPLNAIQLLWINLISDVAPAIALSLEEPEDDLMAKPPRSPEDKIISKNDYKKILTEAINITTASLLANIYGLMRYGPGMRASTISFLTLSSAQLLHTVTCKSEEHSLFNRSKLPPNNFLKMSLLFSFGLQTLAIFFPPLRSLLRISPLGITDVLVIGSSSLLSLSLNESKKLLTKG